MLRDLPDDALSPFLECGGCAALSRATNTKFGSSFVATLNDTLSPAWRSLNWKIDSERDLQWDLGDKRQDHVNEWRARFARWPKLSKLLGVSSGKVKVVVSALDFGGQPSPFSKASVIVVQLRCIWGGTRDWECRELTSLCAQPRADETWKPALCPAVVIVVKKRVPQEAYNVDEATGRWPLRQVGSCWSWLTGPLRGPLLVREQRALSFSWRPSLEPSAVEVIEECATVDSIPGEDTVRLLTHWAGQILHCTVQLATFKSRPACPFLGELVECACPWEDRYFPFGRIESIAVAVTSLPRWIFRLSQEDERKWSGYSFSGASLGRMIRSADPSLKWSSWAVFLACLPCASPCSCDNCKIPDSQGFEAPLRVCLSKRDIAPEHANYWRCQFLGEDRGDLPCTSGSSSESDSVSTLRFRFDTDEEGFRFDTDEDSEEPYHRPKVLLPRLPGYKKCWDDSSLGHSFKPAWDTSACECSSCREFLENRPPVRRRMRFKGDPYLFYHVRCRRRSCKRYVPVWDARRHENLHYHRPVSEHSW